MSKKKNKKKNATAFPVFTQEMKATHKLLIPQMAPIHFRIVADIIRQDGYDIEVLQNTGPQVKLEGLQYVHNDACYPALLVVGQFIDALKSGKYDLDKTALIITQTGGGCRASNYIHLLRKALVKAGFPQVPVASINFSGLEQKSGFRMSLPMLRKAFAACLYGDELMALHNQVAPYETHPGDSKRTVERWQDEIVRRYAMGKGKSLRDMRRIFEEIAYDFAHIPVEKRPKIKVGIVGEIYVKYAPLGNNHLEEFLLKEGCEVNMPGLLGFMQYCIVNAFETVRMYGGSKIKRWALEQVLRFMEKREECMIASVQKHSNLRAPNAFSHTMRLSEGFIGRGVKMGEGWLLTAEMVELVTTGFSNIICAQPFGCLPNHVAGKAMIGKIREVYPEANITAIDYDPGATEVNQENRIKLMLSVAAPIIKAGTLSPTNAQQMLAAH